MNKNFLTLTGLTVLASDFGRMGARRPEGGK